MRTFILTWNPKRWAWESFESDRAALVEGTSVPSRWSCGRAKNLRPGDEFYLLRQGSATNGIIGYGKITSDVFEAERWDTSQTSNTPGNFVNIEILTLLDPTHALDLDNPQLAPDLQKLRALRSGGVQLPSEQAIELETLWKQHLESGLDATKPLQRPTPNGRSALLSGNASSLSQLRSELKPGEVYSWEWLAPHLGIKPGYFSIGGGMITRRERGITVLVTYPHKPGTNVYGDAWESERLIYTGRGKNGDQLLIGANLDVSENRTALLVFEKSDAKIFKFLGFAKCDETREEQAPGLDGVLRKVLKFKLSFENANAADNDVVASSSAAFRAFDPNRVAAAWTKELTETDEAMKMLLAEKASIGHHTLLSQLHQYLVSQGWTDIWEYPSSIDLMASRGDVRVIFEAKTITTKNCEHQCRAALAQLYEYRLLYGTSCDLLCLVVDARPSEARLGILNSLGVAVILISDSGFSTVGNLSAKVPSEI